MARGRPFAKGNPGGPGRKPVDPSIKEALEALTAPAVAKLRELLGSENDKVAMMAVHEVLDRNLGKAVQPVDVSGMSDDEIRAELKRMAREAVAHEEIGEEATH